MGLLDSVLGSVLNAQQGAGPAAQGGLADVLGGLLGQAQGGAQPGEPGGLGALLPVLIGLVSNNGQTGGLGGLLLQLGGQSGHLLLERFAVVFDLGCADVTAGGEDVAVVPDLINRG